MANQPEALVRSFAGEPRVNDPRVGHVEGAREPHAFAHGTANLLREREAVEAYRGETIKRRMRAVAYSTRSNPNLAATSDRPRHPRQKRPAIRRPLGHRPPARRALRPT